MMKLLIMLLLIQLPVYAGYLDGGYYTQPTPIKNNTNYTCIDKKNMDYTTMNNHLSQYVQTIECKGKNLFVTTETKDEKWVYEMKLPHRDTCQSIKNRSKLFKCN